MAGLSRIDMNAYNSVQLNERVAPVSEWLDSVPTPAVLPEWAAQFGLSIAPEHRSDAERVFGDMPLPPDLAKAVARRRFDFRAGRFCARRALQAIACHHADAPLGRTGSGAVAWPSGVTGSITHTREFVWAAVATSHDASAIGIDCEHVISSERAHHVARAVAWACEVDAARGANLDRLTALTLVFSAKESFFKCVHSRVGRLFGFHDVRIVSVDAASRQFCVRVTKTLSSSLVCGSELTGRFAVDDGRVYTGMFLPPHRDADRPRRS